MTFFSTTVADSMTHNAPLDEVPKNKWVDENLFSDTRNLFFGIKFPSSAMKDAVLHCLRRRGNLVKRGEGTQLGKGAGFDEGEEATLLRRRRIAFLRTGLYAGWELEFRLPEPLPGYILKLKLSTKVEIYSSSPN